MNIYCHLSSFNKEKNYYSPPRFLFVQAFIILFLTTFTALGFTSGDDFRYVDATYSRADFVWYGDFNGDGYTDILDSDGYIFFSDEGKFYPDVATQKYTRPFSGLAGDELHVVDINGDGVDDILREGGGGPSVHMHINDGTGENFTYKSHEVWYLSPKDTNRVMSVFPSDFDNDGDIDMAVCFSHYLSLYGYTEYRTQMLFQDETGHFSGDLIDNDLIWFEAAADFDGDGMEELIYTTYPSTYQRDDELSIVLKRNADGTFTHTQLPNRIYSIRTGDFDNDGDIDIAGYSNYNFNELVHVFQNDGEGNFTSVVNSNFGYDGSIHAVYLEDFNLDGQDDLLICGWTDEPREYFVSRQINNGDMTFTTLDSMAILNVTYTGDLDHDGDIDFADDTYLYYNKQDPSRLQFPNGGERLAATFEDTIRWSASYPDLIDIEYTINDGADWITIVSGTENDGEYVWSVPETLSKECRIRMKTAGTPCVIDESDSNFMIHSSGVKLLTPNSSTEYIRKGDLFEFTWSTRGEVTGFHLQYSVDTGSTWSTIASVAGDATSYTWSVDYAYYKGQLFRIIDTVDSDIVSVTASIIPMKAEKEVILWEPYGGDYYENDKSILIDWYTNGDLAAVDIHYSIDSGATWEVVVENTEDDGQHYWTPTGIESHNCLIRVSDNSDPSVFMQSGSVFGIGIPRKLTLTAPNGKEVLNGGKATTITWETEGYVPYVMLEYSEKNDWTLYNGEPWVTLGAKIPNTGSYEWDVPNVTTYGVLVRVTQPGNYAAQDRSDTLFRIVESDVINTVDRDSIWRDTSDVSAVDSSLIGDAPTEDTVVTTVAIDSLVIEHWKITDTLTNDVVTSSSAPDLFTRTLVLDTLSTKIDTLKYAGVAIELFDVKSLQGVSGIVVGPNPVSIADGEVFIAVPEQYIGTLSITIFDALGNVLDRQEFDTMGNAIYRWDLRNEFGNTVGAGSYVALIAIDFIDGSREVIKRTIGVRE